MSCDRCVWMKPSRIFSGRLSLADKQPLLYWAVFCVSGLKRLLNLLSSFLSLNLFVCFLVYLCRLFFFSSTCCSFKPPSVSPVKHFWIPDGFTAADGGFPDGGFLLGSSVSTALDPSACLSEFVSRNSYRSRQLHLKSARDLEKL